MTPETASGRAVMDYPTAWEYVRTTSPEDHADACSWRTTNGALLCDCSIIWKEYGRREALAAARTAVEALRADRNGNRTATTTIAAVLRVLEPPATPERTEP